MPNGGCPPDSDSYGILNSIYLERLLKQRSCSPSVVTYSLIHGLYLSKKISEAIGLLEEMKSNGIEPKFSNLFAVGFFLHFTDV